MLRIIQNSTAAGAKSYYSTADYYTQGQELVGEWRGKLAERLGLSGEVEKGEWDALCDNKDPQTGCRLTARQRQDRRIGYDFNFHAPKSLSLFYGLTQDDRVLDAFREAVDSTMQEIESEMQTRVRVKGKNEDRTTGEMVWGEFIHTTARPVDGIPDPHLHAHCFVHNVTWDKAEERFKAGQFAGVKRDAQYFEALFHSRLSHSLAELGLPIERTKKGWELATIPTSALVKMSRRTVEIEAIAERKGVTDAKEKGELGAKTRAGKVKELPLDQLRETWRSWLSEEEGESVHQLGERIGGDPVVGDKVLVADAVSRSISHSFERRAVVPERTLIATALKNAYGAAAPEAVAHEVAQRPLLRATRNGQASVTTREVLAEEQRMLRFAREGRGTCRPFAIGEHAFVREWLSDEQKTAVQRLLRSRDTVQVLRGRAGTGKTSSLQELAEGIEAGGKKLFAFAPSAEASRTVLRADGFADADTVASLLVNEQLQKRIAGQVILIDEAGLLSSPDMRRVFDLADHLDARVILSGDRKQHASVARGSALKLLEEEAGIVPAEIREIRRQKGDYKRAVKALSEGRTEEGFRDLDRLGWIREVGDSERYQALAADYLASTAGKQTALVVAPTHREGALVTDAIRSQLKAQGRLGQDERVFSVLQSANLTEAERADPVNYSPGDVLVYHQNAKGHIKGDRLAVGEAPLPLDQAARFTVFRPKQLALAPGDVLRVTRNGETADGAHRLNNGALFTVKGFDDGGNLKLENGWTIGRNFGHLTHGYATTSYAAQGKTVDRVILGQSSMSAPAASREQGYVSLSRGRRSAAIYTDDKQALLEAVSRDDDRLTAIDLLRHGVLGAERHVSRHLGNRQPEREREGVVRG